MQEACPVQVCRGEGGGRGSIRRSGLGRNNLSSAGKSAGCALRGPWRGVDRLALRPVRSWGMGA